MIDLRDVFVEADRLVNFTRFFTHSGTRDDFCQIGVRTKCSYKPPPMAAAIEKQRRINDQRTTYGFISLTAPRMCAPVHLRSLRIAWAWYSPAFGAA